MSSDQLKIKHFYEVKAKLSEKVEKWKEVNGLEGVEGHIGGITEGVFLSGFLLKRLRDELLNDE